MNPPAPRVHFGGFGDSSLNFEVRVWINEPHKHPQIRSKVNFAIDRVFREHKIEIPFPQRDFHLRLSSVGAPEVVGSPDILKVAREPDER